MGDEDGQIHQEEGGLCCMWPFWLAVLIVGYYFYNHYDLEWEDNQFAVCEKYLQKVRGWSPEGATTKCDKSRKYCKRAWPECRSKRVACFEDKYVWYTRRRLMDRLLRSELNAS